jgi:hypothetical protein
MLTPQAIARCRTAATSATAQASPVGLASELSRGSHGTRRPGSSLRHDRVVAAMHRFVTITAALVSLIGCAQHQTRRPAAVPLRATQRAVDAGSLIGDAALEAQVETQVETQTSNDFPMDPESVSLGATLRTWVADAATDTGRPLVLVRMTAPRLAYSDQMMTEATVRDERSGAAVILRLFVQCPPFLSMQWRRQEVQRDRIAGAVAIRAAEDWLNDRPELVTVSRQRLDGTAVLWTLSTAQSTTACAAETPSHGPIIESCWTEREPIATVPHDAIEYEYGRRNHLRVAYSLRETGRRVRVRIDEQGRGRRAEARGPRGGFGPSSSVTTVAQPAISALAFVEATMDGAAGQRALRFSTETERTSCVRTDRWRCEPVTPVGQPGAAP